MSVRRGVACQPFAMYLPSPTWYQTFELPREPVTDWPVTRHFSGPRAVSPAVPTTPWSVPAPRRTFRWPTDLLEHYGD